MAISTNNRMATPVREFRGRVAVITGAASGIGRALALRAVDEGMKVVLADIEGRPLRALAGELKRSGSAAIAVPTDVRRPRQIARLARRAYAAYGAVHLLFNNAGVGCSDLAWDIPDRDWEWVLGVNLWGTIHGLREFVPLMLSQGQEGHIVNTASILGLLTAPHLGAYSASKHAVMALSETLYQELQATGGRIGVSVLCPAFVKSGIMDSARNRRHWFWKLFARRTGTVQNARDAGWQRLVDLGMDGGEVARLTFDGIREGRFYIAAHAGFQCLIDRRLENLRQQRNPAPFDMREVIAAARVGADPDAGRSDCGNNGDGL